MKLYGLIGYPLGHSFSKKYFSEKFQKENITDCRYDLFPITSITDLPALLKNNALLHGLNVTIPYKQSVLPFVTDETHEVKKIGAANTIKIIGDNLIAYNTDVIGFEKSFVKNLQAHHTKALVLGTGGSSKAVQFVLKKFHMDFLLVTRNEELKTGVINYSMIDELILNEYTVIINCTPVGLYPNVDVCPALPYQFISDKHYLFDLIYQPEKTWFLKNGEEKNAIIKNGYEMLVIQAEESWRIWNED
ncbi:MAG: shikimate dehydrogenase [Bacteroidota bacterium]|nr:shikimate dehydrogenase [Bacteroidota bacterium]